MRVAPALEARILYSRSVAARDPESAWESAAPAARAGAAQVAKRLDRLGARAAVRGEADFPPGLLDLPDAPRVVFLRGHVPPLGSAVAIVGARAASPYGMAQAAALAAGLARLGYTIVSGLARGVDGAAHRGALEAGGGSVAVLPGGLDEVVPRHHADLAEALCARGGLLTEQASGPPRYRAVFLARNRLIAALASATVVVEAAARSGALATAASARRLGRAVLAVPGDVDRETSRGTHALIRSGAALCEGAGDVLREIEHGRRRDPPRAAGSRLCAALGPDPRPVEELAAAAGLDLPETLGLLLELEWSGVATAAPGQRWRRASP